VSKKQLAAHYGFGHAQERKAALSLVLTPQIYVGGGGLGAVGIF